MGKIKVMHVLTDSNIGGAGTLLCNTLRCGDGACFDYTVVLPRGSRLIERLRQLPCRIIEVDHGRDRSMDARAIVEYVSLLRREQPDILHTHASLSARIAGRLCRIPVCLQTRHCVFPLRPWQKNGGFRCLFRWGSRLLSDRVIAVADAARENLLELGMDDEQIAVIINGVMPVRPCEEAEVDALRQQLKLTRVHFVVGMVARLEGYKGQGTLLDAAAQCLRRQPTFRFLLIGDGSERARYEAQARALGIENCVRFVGFVSDMAPYYALMDVNVNASYGTETSSLALSEGMSVGVPAVASAYGGNPHMVREGENGLLFPPHDADALARALLLLHQDEQLRKRLSVGAKLRYDTHFTAQAMVRQLENVYLQEWNKKQDKRPAKQHAVQE